MRGGGWVGLWQQPGRAVTMRDLRSRVNEAYMMVLIGWFIDST